MQFLSGLFGFLGPGLIAVLMIVLWDLSRIYVQSKWLVKKLNQESECQRCQAMAKQVKAIADKLGIEDESEHSGPD